MKVVYASRSGNVEKFVMKLGRHNFYVSKGTDNAGTSAGTDPSPGT